MQDSEEPFPQNQEAAKRFKGGQKRKQPGPSSSTNTPSSLASSPPSQVQSPPAHFASVSSPPLSSISSSATTTTTATTTNTTATSPANRNRGLVYQQPVSLQHQHLPSQFLSLDHSTFTSSGPSAYQLYNDATVVATNGGGFFAPYSHITSAALPSSSSTSEVSYF